MRRIRLYKVTSHAKAFNQGKARMKLEKAKRYVFKQNEVLKHSLLASLQLRTRRHLFSKESLETFPALARDKSRDVFFEAHRKADEACWPRSDSERSAGLTELVFEEEAGAAALGYAVREDGLAVRQHVSLLHAVSRHHAALTASAPTQERLPHLERGWIKVYKVVNNSNSSTWIYPVRTVSPIGAAASHHVFAPDLSTQNVS